MAKDYYYFKPDPIKGNAQRAPNNDLDGSITGKIVIGVEHYFDENPEERKRLGWIKMITHGVMDLEEFDSATQLAFKTVKTIDAYTCEEEIHVADKSEEQLLFEEMYDAMNELGGITFRGGW